MGARRGVNVGVTVDRCFRVGPPAFGEVLEVDFSTPFGVGLDRPTTATGLAASLGITNALPMAIVPCDEASGVVLQERISGAWLTGSAGVAFAGGVGAGLPTVGTRSLTSLPVATISGQGINALTAPNNSLLDFPSGSVAMLAVLRTAPGADVNNGRGLIGKLTNAGTTGYGIDTTAGIGGPLIRCGDGGVGSSLTATSLDHYIFDGAWHYMAVIFDRTTNNIRCITDVFAETSASMAVVTGSMSSNGAGIPFRLGVSRGNTFSLGNQFAYLAMFTGSNAEALVGQKARLDAWWQNRVGTVPVGWTYSRASSVMCPIGSGSSGVILNNWGIGQFAQGWGSALSGSGLGAICIPATTNLLGCSDVTQANQASLGNVWAHSASVTSDYGLDPRQVVHSLRVQKTGSQDKITTAIQLTSGTQYCFSIYTRSTSSVPFLRVMNDKLPGTVMWTECSRSDGQAVRADSGWHQVFLRYTPSSGSLYRFEALPSSHSSSVGDCEFQYSQVQVSIFPSAVAWSNGTAATIVKTVLGKALPNGLTAGLGRRGALEISAQYDSQSQINSRGSITLGSSASLNRSHGHTRTSANDDFYVVDDGGSTIAQVLTSTSAGQTETYRFIEWDAKGIRGANSTMYVQAGSLVASGTTSISGVSDPTWLYVGSFSDETGQMYGTVQKVTVYRLPPRKLP